jgi:outer membrane protein OmpA-like peptidoglycan-associated protein
MAGPMVIGFINKRVRSEGMNMRDLGSLLHRESAAIREALPAGLADVFWPSTARTAAAGTTPVVAQTVRREGSSFSWLPLVALAIFVPALLWLAHHGRRPVNPAAPPVTTSTAPLGTADRMAPEAPNMANREMLDKADVQFDTGSSKLRPESEAVLDDMAATLKKNPNMHMTVDGYTDNVGNPDSNMKLSQSRANSVMADMVHKGISPDRLTAEGHGEENPLDDNSTAAGRAHNRRVTVVVVQHP